MGCGSETNCLIYSLNVLSVRLSFRAFLRNNFGILSLFREFQRCNCDAYLMVLSPRHKPCGCTIEIPINTGPKPQMPWLWLQALIQADWFSVEEVIVGYRQFLKGSVRERQTSACVRQKCAFPYRQFFKGSVMEKTNSSLQPAQFKYAHFPTDSFQRKA